MDGVVVGVGKEDSSGKVLDSTISYSGKINIAKVEGDSSIRSSESVAITIKSNIVGGKVKAASSEGEILAESYICRYLTAANLTLFG